jgi:phosphotransferase family enzyme
MSYPLSLQALVIEDQEGPKEAYELAFKTIASELDNLPFRPAAPCFAFSHEQAVDHLNRSKIFHIVILDLHLPDKPRMPQAEGIELGLDLLVRFTDRDRFPVPCLLVISGHVGSTEQTRLQDAVRDGFHYGRLFSKGTDYGFLENQIRRAYAEAIRYCSVGIHLRNAGSEQFPTVTPREEDLLRRAVLKRPGTVGLDLDWWSARRFSNGFRDSSGAPANTWTKVLMGRYLLKDGEGASRPNFFKLLPGSDAHSVIESVCQVEQKLSHIKLTSTVTSKSTALVVTEKVGAQEGRPEPLETFFRRATSEQAADVARQISEQVRELGDTLPTSKMLKTILWPAHDINRLDEQWSRLRAEIQQQLTIDANPIELYTELARSEEKLRLNEQSLLHGDLHISNVALDIVDDKPVAYIFDPGVISRNVAGRDLAVLEVSVILHQQLNSETLSQVCSALYQGVNITETKVGDAPISDPIGKNIVEFVRVLRKCAEASNELAIYALLVFDCALIQVGGLAFGSNGNKIHDQRDAVYLLAVTAEWYRTFRTPHK